MASRSDPPAPWSRRALRTIGTALAYVCGLYLVGRAVAELVLTDPHRPASYRHDWGGPTYLGVLTVHCGPGLLLAGWYLTRLRTAHSRSRTPPEASARSPHRP